MIIDVKKLGKTYDNDGVKTQALKEVTFGIKAGEFVAIMGPSGSGKSTLLHVLGFLEKLTHGSYHFDGKEATHYTEDEIAHIRNKKVGFVFQAFNLLPRTTVLENVRLPLLYSDVPEQEWHERAMKAIAVVGLEHRIEHESSQLSGGEKQRVAIARALVNDPQVIFADEPTGNLDSRSGAAVMDTLQKLNEEQGHTIILITHETNTAEYAHRIIRIRDGLLESDTLVAKRRRGSDGMIK